VVEDVADLWALERAGVGGALSRARRRALTAGWDRADDLSIDQLLRRAPEFSEIVLAVNATVEGRPQRTTSPTVWPVRAQGHAPRPRRPVGGELDYLDEGTLSQALKARTEI
jgi:recombination protein RecR